MLICGCSSSKEKNQDIDQPGQSKADTANAGFNMQDKPEPEITPAPGSLRAEAEVIDIEETDNGLHCILKIVKINGYGASTPPLAEGTELKATVSREILLDANPEFDKTDNVTAEALAEKLASIPFKNVLLKYQQVPNLPGVKPNPWRVLSIRP